MAELALQEPAENKEEADDLEAMFVEYEKRVKEFESNVCELPVDANRIIAEHWKEHRPQTLEHMKGCYPLIHGGVISLAFDFLSIKRKHGTQIEQKLYADMTLTQFFHRLATKRCVVFFQTYDSYLLRNGYNDNGGWELIGTEDENKVTKYDVSPEKKPKLAEYMSYDELIISAMCGISSPTHFINCGSRRNCGKPSLDEYYPAEGIYMGLVGARFERSGVMEHALMSVTAKQNTAENGYGPLGDAHDDNKEQEEQAEDEKSKFFKEMDHKSFMKRVRCSTQNADSQPVMRAFEKFFNVDHLPLYDEVRERWHAEDEGTLKRYCVKNKWDKAPFLDTEMFRIRIQVSIEIFLFDADRRAAECKKSAFCHIVGLGTGVWSFKKEAQDRIICEVTKEIIEGTKLPHIAAVYFSWMRDDAENVFDAEDDGSLWVKDPSGHKINVQRGRRAPCDKLEEPFSECLTVAMYAWDSNSFPGNEYYHGMLMASGDPAAASCSTISYVQNSEINTEHITGANTGVYFYNRDEQQYEFHKLGDMHFEDNKAKWLKKSLHSIPHKRDGFKSQIDHKQYVD